MWRKKCPSPRQIAINKSIASLDFVSISKFPPKSPIGPLPTTCLFTQCLCHIFPFTKTWSLPQFSICHFQNRRFADIHLQRQEQEEFAELRAEEAERAKAREGEKLTSKYGLSSVNMTAVYCGNDMGLPALIKIKDHVRDHMKNTLAVLCLVSLQFTGIKKETTNFFLSAGSFCILPCLWRRLLVSSYLVRVAAKTFCMSSKYSHWITWIPYSSSQQCHFHQTSIIIWDNKTLGLYFSMYIASSIYLRFSQ